MGVFSQNKRVKRQRSKRKLKSTNDAYDVFVVEQDVDLKRARRLGDVDAVVRAVAVVAHLHCHVISRRTCVFVFFLVAVRVLRSALLRNTGHDNQRARNQRDVTKKKKHRHNNTNTSQTVGVVVIVDVRVAFVVAVGVRATAALLVRVPRRHRLSTRDNQCTLHTRTLHIRTHIYDTTLHHTGPRLFLKIKNTRTKFAPPTPAKMHCEC